MGFAIAGGIAASGLLSYAGSQSAAGAEESAANSAEQTSANEFGIINQENAPYRNAADSALNTINNDQAYFNQPFTMQQFQQSPGYQFQLEQGENAINNAAAARGVAGGTANLENLNNYAQGSANTDYQNAFNNYQAQQSNIFNRLSTVAGLGSAANSTVAQAGSVASTNQANAAIGAGNAAAAGYVGGANAVSGAIGTGINTWMGQQYLNSINGGGGGPSLSQISNVDSSSPYWSSNPYASAGGQ